MLPDLLVVLGGMQTKASHPPAEPWASCPSPRDSETTAQPLFLNPTHICSNNPQVSAGGGVLGYEEKHLSFPRPLSIWPWPCPRG